MRAHGNVDRKRLDTLVHEFTDEIFQTPPMRSAVKRQLRTRRIHRLEVLEISGRDVLFEVECDAGTYIRSLAVDMGDALAVGAHLQDLRRTRAGALTEDDAVQMHDLKDAMEAHKEGDSSHIKNMMKPMEALLAQMPKVEVKDSAVDAICHGANVAIPGIVSLDDDIGRGAVVAIMSLSGEGVALGHALMSSEEVIDRAEGFAVDVSRVFMQPGTYEKGWTSPER
jgi:H/ACA ribonucleoprotein complex subunit 4